MTIEFKEFPKLALYGYSPENAEAIWVRILSGVKPSSLKGDFVLIAEGMDATTQQPLVVFVSTVISAVPYFYYLSETGCIHADNVFDVCKKATLGWDWNWDALVQMILLEHVIGNNSLHAKIFRVPQASITIIRGNKIEINSESFWEEIYNLTIINLTPNMPQNCC